LKNDRDISGLRGGFKHNHSAVTRPLIPSSNSIFSKPSHTILPVDPSGPTDQQHKLVLHFNDIFQVDRAVALNILRDYSADLENNEKIVFVIMQVLYNYVSCWSPFLEVL